MTAQAVTDGLQKIKPTSEQVSVYARRENELRQRYLKGVLDVDAVLEGLQRLMEMTRGCINCNGQPEIPNWADQEKPISQHIPCGMVDPAKLATEAVFQKNELYLNGEEFVARAQKLEGAMNACAFDFYARSENWKYLPEKDVDIIVFPNTVFRGSDGDRFVRYLYRGGLEWDRNFHWLDYGFGCRYRVAVLASLLPLAPETS